jgi:hypothetical protein
MENPFCESPEGLKTGPEKEVRNWNLLPLPFLYLSLPALFFAGGSNL